MVKSMIWMMTLTLKKTNVIPFKWSWIVCVLKKAFVLAYMIA